MKKIIAVVALLSAMSWVATAQKNSTPKLPDYTFETELANPITPVKDQYRSGTCWAFSTIGFVESEIIRINRIKDAAQYPDFSEMFVVSKSYQDRADKYVRMDGNLRFSAGSEGEDVLHIIRDYGLVPQSAMPGLNYGTDKHVHAELDELAKAYVDVVVKNPNRKISTAWKKGFKGVMDAYLGECPESFEVNGKTYTPASYRDSFKFNPDDYVCLTSFTHHPFYTWFDIEVCDNWRGDKCYNVPIDELMALIDSSLKAGYTMEWGADVSAAGFTRDGLALRLDLAAVENAGSDQAHWTGEAEQKEQNVDVVKEIVPTQESRQIEFDNKTMTDDHGMLIYGIAHNQFGKKFYMIKNSWGITGKYDGIWYASEAFMKAQTLTITVHKSALSPELKKRIGIK